MKQFTFFVAVVLLVIGASRAAGYVDFTPEAPCSAKGGRCVLSSECPDSKLPKDLCPKQRAQGAECCHKVPDSDKRCKSYGGECVSNCPPVVTRKDLECPAGTSCCIWL